MDRQMVRDQQLRIDGGQWLGIYRGVEGDTR